jgi:hypothetical protein
VHRARSTLTITALCGGAGAKKAFIITVSEELRQRATSTFSSGSVAVLVDNIIPILDILPPYPSLHALPSHRVCCIIHASQSIHYGIGSTAAGNAFEGGVVLFDIGLSWLQKLA